MPIPGMPIKAPGPLGYPIAFIGAIGKVLETPQLPGSPNDDMPAGPDGIDGEVDNAPGGPPGPAPGSALAPGPLPWPWLGPWP